MTTNWGTSCSKITLYLSCFLDYNEYIRFKKGEIMQKKISKHTISGLAQNIPGVLAQIADEFKQYNVNINSISAGETEKADVSRIVISVEGHDDEVRKIIKDLNQFKAIISVDDLADKNFIDRELALIKVMVNDETTTKIMQIVEIFRANVVGMGVETITIELTGNEEKVTGFIKMLAPYGIRSMCRSGVIGLKRGDEI